MRAKFVALVMMFAPAIAGAAMPPPTLSRDAGGVTRAALPRLLLQDRTVDKHLHSGLTTTFVLQVAKQAVARVEIRFELWDELYLVRAVGTDGREQRARFRDRGQLEQWWSAPSLVVGKRGELDAPAAVDLLVLPFSAGEEADAKRWLARSVTPGSGASGSGGAETSTPPTLFNAVVDSSVRRRPVQRYSWLVNVKALP